MRSAIRKIAWMLALLLVLALPVPAFAASASVSADSSVVVGKNVKVTLSFSGGESYIAGVLAYISYDSAKLKYTGASGDGSANIAGGSGTVALETTSTSKTNLKITLTFTALETGDAQVSITGSDIVDWEGNTLGGPTSGKTITVKAQEAPKPDPEPDQDQETEQEPEVEEPSEPTDLETALPVEVNGSKLVLWTNLSNVQMPEGYTAQTVVYNGEQVQAAVREDLGLTLVYLTSSEGANGKFYVYNGFNAFEPYQTLTVGGNTYILMQPAETVRFPKDYTRGEEEINSEKVPAWVNTADADRCYLYAVHEDAGQPGIYVYDRKENTLQRVHEQMYGLLLDSEVIHEPAEQQESSEIEQPEETEEKGLLDRIVEDDGILMVMIGVLGVSLLAVVFMATRLKAAKRKQQVQLAAQGQMPEAKTQDETEAGPEATEAEQAQEVNEAAAAPEAETVEAETAEPEAEAPAGDPEEKEQAEK